MSDAEVSCWVCRTRPAASAGALCDTCERPTQTYDAAWDRLSQYLLKNWKEVVRRGSFDLGAAFGSEAAVGAVRTHLHFLKLLGARIAAEGVHVDLTTFGTALSTGRPHAEVTLLIAHCSADRSKFLHYDSTVSVLRRDEQVYSAMWMDLTYPIAVKVCYLARGAPVLEPDGFPWHPDRQRKVVKLSPYKGDTKPVHARRDLRM